MVGFWLVSCWFPARMLLLLLVLLLLLLLYAAAAGAIVVSIVVCVPVDILSGISSPVDILFAISSKEHFLMAQPRLLLVPGGLNEEVVRKTLKQNLWQRVKPQPKHNGCLYAVVCDDAHDKRSKCVQKYLRQLLADVIEDRDFQVGFVSFHDANVRDHIERCDVFLMAGGEPNRFLDVLTRYPKHWQELCDRIQTGEIMYIGRCGGAVICGRYYRPNTETQLLNFINANITIPANSAGAAAMPLEMYGITFINMTKKNCDSGARAGS